MNQDNIRKSSLELGRLLAEEMRRDLNQINDSPKLWCRKWMSQKEKGHSENLLRELKADDPKGYKKFLRMTPETFDIILRKIGPAIQKEHTNMRAPIPARTKLEITLHYLACGEDFSQLEYGFRVSKSSISSFIPEVLEELLNKFESDYTKFPRNRTEWMKKEREFADRWNFPNCVGAIDGKHIRIDAPPKSGSIYYNYKGYFSMSIMALVDASYKCIWLSYGNAGSDSDATVYSTSTLKAALDRGILPPNMFIVGDDAFPLCNEIMKPYSGSRLSNEDRIFNYRLSRARNVVENFFGLLANRFRVFLTQISVDIQTVELIIRSGVLLHNLLLNYQNETYLSLDSVDRWREATCVPGSWRQNNQQNLDGDISRGLSTNGQHRRNQLRNYVNGDGAVPWQNKCLE